MGGEAAKGVRGPFSGAPAFAACAHAAALPRIRIAAEGDAALTVRLAEVPSERAAGLVAAAVEALGAAELPAPFELVPAYCAVTVCYDPLAATFAEMSAAVYAALADLDPGVPTVRRVVELPVCYGGELGPDLDDVARHAGLSAGEVVALHSGRAYRIDMLGFLPGFAYCTGMDPRLATPRLAVPRTRIPAGSVGIAGEQTGVYPLSSPGGWNLIGRTPARVYDPGRADPIPYRAGDWLRFVPVDRAVFDGLAARVAAGEDVARVREEPCGEGGAHGA